MSRWRVMVLALTALMAMHLVEVRAEDYPTHNVTILVPFAPGGGTDLLARAYAQILENKYGYTFVIENRPGGGTTIAATAAANATPDGYTLVQGTSGTMAMNPTIFKHLSYEPLKTLVPVSLVAGVPFVLTVNPALPVHSVADLVALAKKRSAEGKPLTYGSGGVGTFHHLCAELFSSLTGIKMTHVPYRGSAPSTMALISGQIDVLFVDLGPMLPQIRAGKARVLGITSDKPFPTAPDIKPISESGLPSWPNTVAWQMLLATGGTPRPILEKLNKDVNAAVQSPEMNTPLEKLGMIGLGNKSLEQLNDYVKAETVHWAKVIKEANLAGTQ
ncbi:MAG TPA: tripartite tricarboxylate transporter substrate-binding protein [Xanthobacteraceae bacterium]|nr:tripartite tricarboxylate transporter substrate-binding protein [Xanthobacteraceae bacterium]